MKKAGFIVFVGIEAGNNSDLVFYNKKATVIDNKRIIQMLKDVDMDVLYGFIFINPYSTEETLKENFKFLLETNCSDMHLYMTRLQVYYNTAIYYKAKKEGLLKENYTYKGSSFEYKFINDFVQNIVDYYDSHFLTDQLIINFNSKLTNFLLYYYYNMKVILEDTDKIKNSTEQLLSNITETCATYFSIVYIENDIIKFDKKLPHLKSDIEMHLKDLEIIKANLIRKYLKSKK
jgi:hypothetical protein